ncbi:MarR family transcriptional regulator [Curtobacterium flaccumfaciens]|uniref:MarR family winged helix-turn-helix transcriptional regulator n=1 Tax=Curtobacterium flaccumfaciens TaxID=2035 RepID=UPI00217E16C7|nr:MarR family transcriptional regulator [Curtobacterium flaccumfaciens]MCS6558748.1 MarR family transcriptional regulator [Curtobacterium flaccumfaciens]
MADDDITDESSSNPLDEMLCFNLYAAARATNRLYTTLLAPWDLTYPQYLVLKLLWSREPLTVGEIAKSLMLDSGTTTPLVRRLETRGLLTRTRSTSDERVVTVTLTTEGRALDEEMSDLTDAIGTATGLEVPDAMSTISNLRTINDNLADALALAAKTNMRKASR